MQITNTHRTESAERLLEVVLSAAPDPRRFAEISTTIDCWDDLFHSALLHGVETYLHYCLMQAGIRLPAPLIERNERWVAIRNLWQTHIQGVLHDVLQTLESAGVCAVALKGPILGERVYPDPRMRPSADLDVLVGYADLDRATEALSSIGFRPRVDAEERFLRKYHYHTILSRSCPPVIELHFSLSDGFGVIVPAEEFLCRADIYRTSQGDVAHILTPEDELLHLCIHAAGHRFARLSWLCDIQLLLRRYPRLNWEIVVERARTLNVLASFLFTCETLRRRLAVPVPIIRRGVAQQLRTAVANFLLSMTARQPDPSRRALLGKIAFMTVLCDRPYAAVRFLRRQLLLIARRRARRHFPALAPEEWSY